MKMYRAGFDIHRTTRRAPRARLYMHAGIALAIGLSGCAGKPPARVPPPVMDAPAIPEPVEPPIVPTSKPQPPKPKVIKPAVKAPEAPAPVDSPAPGQVISQILGMSQDDLRKAFGEPQERIDQGPGQAWIYKTPKCTVEILFFLDVTRNGYYALDRKLSVAGDPAERACYMDIQNARQR